MGKAAGCDLGGKSIFIARFFKVKRTFSMKGEKAVEEGGQTARKQARQRGKARERGEQGVAKATGSRQQDMQC